MAKSKPIFKLTVAVKSDSGWYNSTALGETTIDVPIEGDGIDNTAALVGNEAYAAAKALLTQPAVARRLTELMAAVDEPADA